jgi:predicted TPR repeat methyltransferase
LSNNTHDSGLFPGAVSRNFEFALEDNTASMAQLQAIMIRAQTHLAPGDFIRVVSTAFQREQATFSEQQQNELRNQSAFKTFLDVLRSASEACRKPVSVAVLGCGEGFAGLGPDFAAGVVKEVFNPRDLDSVTEIVVTPELLQSESRLTNLLRSIDSPVDLVVSFSFFHFIPCLHPLFWFLNQLVSPAGHLVMAHEPNSRYWRNPVLQDAFARLQRAKRFRRRLRVLRSSLLGRRPATVINRSAELLGLVNARLRREFAFKDDLKENELTRIVDVHRPEVFRSGFRIGLDGFDIAALQNGYLREFDLVNEFTVGHLGYNDPRLLPARWQKIERQLAATYPLDGCLVSTHCRRK